jgi:hypothetical protein
MAYTLTSSIVQLSPRWTRAGPASARQGTAGGSR